jgi:hypothetical protein
LLLQLLNLGNELIKARTDQEVDWYQILGRAGILRKLPNGHLSNPYAAQYIETTLGRNLQTIVEQDVARLKQNSRRIRMSPIICEDKYYKEEATLIS